MAEMEACPYRYRLPIMVRSNPSAANPATDGQSAVDALRAYGAPSGSLVALDTETALDSTYVKAFYTVVTSHGYKVIDYGSKSYVFGNEIPDGYYWAADWTGSAHMDMGALMTQYENEGTYDASVANPNLPFWDTWFPPVPGSWKQIISVVWQSTSEYNMTGVGNDNCLWAVSAKVAADGSVKYSLVERISGPIST